ncbi:MAG TPA: glycosyltransferase [Pseudomonadales bacterium]|nr:glycosyltransferase [Pseudomonadales bacterium]
MKVNVVIDSISRANGGLFDAERRLHQALVPLGVNATVFGLNDEFASADAPAWRPLTPRAFSADVPAFLGRSAGLYRALLDESAELVYRAGLWKWPSRYAFEWSYTHKKPEIIAPHGMLDPWAIKNSAWKKRLALLCYERKHLRSAACIRALCDAEAQAIRQFGLPNPICVIPNGIDLPEVKNGKPETQKPPWRDNIEPGQKVLLYLGRIHPKKGLANLIRAWSKVQKAESRKQNAEEWVLAIAGWDQGGHEAELKRLCGEIGLSFADTSSPKAEIRNQKTDFSVSRFQLSAFPASVVFVGPQFNEAKSVCYQHCDAFILPSFSEGLPMVILEAWAYGKSVLMTPECNLPEAFSSRAAIRVEPNEESIAQGLLTLSQSSISDLESTGLRGRALVAERFAWPHIARELLQVYQWLLGNGAKPGCVV